MKYQTISLPFAVACTLAFFVLLSCANSVANAANQPNQLQLSHISVLTKVDLGQVTFTFHVTPSNMSSDVGLQMYVHRQKPDTWEFVQAQDSTGGPKVFPLYRTLDNDITFTASLSPGTYDNFRLLLFDASGGHGINYSDEVYDTAADTVKRTVPMHFEIATSQSRVVSPVLAYAPIPATVAAGDGTYTVTIPAKVKIPRGYQAAEGGLWVMAKGDGGFSQQWVGMNTAKPANDAHDTYLEAPVRFELKGVKPGLWNVQFGVFKATWGDALEWVYPGLDFEVGGDAWVVKSPRRPARVRVFNDRFVKLTEGGKVPASLYPDSPAATRAVSFVRGGNYGNAIGWDIHPALNTPGYFVLLSDLGCRFIRIVYNPDRYINEPLYQHSVDQIIQNIWQSDSYPIIAPQDLPQGNTIGERVERGAALCRQMAENYKGKPVWIELVNEPHEFGTWPEWKPIAERYVKTIRGVDPEAFVIVPLEGFSKDGRGAAKSPITDVAVDLYDAHAYVAPGEVEMRYGPMTRAGLPLLIGEFGGDGPYLRQMSVAFESMRPQPLAIAPWAFTIKGQDSLPLIADGSSATLRYTPAGEAVAHAYNLWNSGKKLGMSN